jgi:hypothetical protein
VSANLKLRATFSLGYSEADQKLLLEKADCEETRWVDQFTVVGPVREVMGLIGTLEILGQPVLTGAYLL